MCKYFLIALACMGIGILPTFAAQAQAPRFTSYAQFNDSLVARYNRGDFKGIEAFGSPALQKLEPAGSMAGLLARQRNQTGRIIGSSALPERKTRHEFAWRGERQNLRVSLVSSAPGVIDDYFISDYIAQPTARATPLPTDNPRRTPLDAAVDRAATLYLQHPEAAGLSIGVYWQGRSYFYNYGEVEKGTGRLPAADTYYEMGSVAKTFVTTLLAQAVVDKKVQLTDDIRGYLPGEFPNLEFQGHPVRFVDLATHTSGLPTTAHVYNQATGARLRALNITERTAYYNQFTADSLLYNLHHMQLSAQPGTTYRYNGVAMSVLQLLLERVYQQPYEQLLTRYVRKRFGLTNTKRILTAQERQRFAMGYEKGMPQPHSDYIGYWGGPGLYSTPTDLLAYARANLAEREPAVRLAHQPAFEQRMGLGWMRDTDPDGQPRLFHNGHSVGFNARCALYPAEQTGIVILVNETISQDRVTELEQQLKQELAAVASPAGKGGKAVGRR